MGVGGAVSRFVEGRVSLAAVLMFIFCYGMGSGPVPWVYLPEVLPDHIKVWPLSPSSPSPPSPLPLGPSPPPLFLFHRNLILPKRRLQFEQWASSCSHLLSFFLPHFLPCAFGSLNRGI